MSTAFDRAMDEISRVWDASDHFDTKVLQFIGIVSAGALASAAIMAEKVHLAAPLPWYVVVLLIVGITGVFAFVGLGMSSAIGIAFDGPLDPRALAQYPPYLKDDAEFEEDMLPVLAETFDECLNSQERKWRRFRWSLLPLGIAVICLTVAAMICVLIPTPRGEKTMCPDNTPRPVNTPRTPRPPAPDSGQKPVLGPYTVTKGRTIPNEPRTGPYPRDTTRHRPQ